MIHTAQKKRNPRPTHHRHTLATSSLAPVRKAQLVNLGVQLLAMGQCGMVQALTRIIQNRGLSHV